MTRQAEHQLTIVDGGTIHLPPWYGGQVGLTNLAPPDIMVADTIQQYPVGTKYVEGDRTFHYCYATDEGGLDVAHATVTVPGLPNSQIGCFYNSNVHYHGDKAGQAEILAGVTELNFAYRIQTDTGYKGNIDIAAHQLAGAMLVSYGRRACYRIIDNDALGDPTARQVKLYLKETVWQAFGNVTHRCYVYPNTYAQCIWPDIGMSHDGLPYAANAGYGGVVAVPLIDPALKSWFWGQTWGPLPLINGVWGNNVGDTANERTFHFDSLGKIVYRGAGTALDSHMQHGGFILASQFVFLQITQ